MKTYTLSAEKKILARDIKMLYSFPIPCYQYVDYYLDTLSRVDYYNYKLQLISKIKAIGTLQDQCESVKSVFYDKVDELVEFFKQEQSVHVFLTQNIESLEKQWRQSFKHNWSTASTTTDRTFFEKKDTLLSECVKTNRLVRFDIKQANFCIFQHVKSLLGNGAPQTWEDICGLNFVPEALHKSKSFRQNVFGYLNIKRLGWMQRFTIQLLEQFLPIPSDKIVHRVNDEIIIDYEALTDTQRKKIDEIDVNNTLFKDTPISVEKTYSNVYPSSTQGLVNEEFDQAGTLEYKFLTHVPKTQFFETLKLDVLNEPVAEEDLLFISEKRLAKWIE